jgi:DNA topoisomerase I
VLATVVSIMDRTQIRIGSPEYEKQNKSYGLSTMKDRHVKENGNAVHLVFKGKTGIQHNIRIESKKLARMVMKCRDLPGQELFQYIDEQGEVKPIDSGMVNEYIKEISGGSFTSKDFRTWKGTVHCLKALLLEACPKVSKARKEAVNKALDEAARQLGNTRAVCRKYYVHPDILTAYECERLHRLMRRNAADTEQPAGEDGYSFEERLVLKVLRTAGRAAKAASTKE